ENHGTNFKTRWRLMRERILAMKEIWTKEEAEFHGEFVNFDPVWSHPKPAQKPHPPILMGGDGAGTHDRVVEFCDGWMPIGFRATDIPEKIATLHKKAEAAGRDPKSLSISIFAAKPDRAAVQELERAGVERVIFNLPSAESDVILPMLDKYVELMS